MDCPAVDLTLLLQESPRDLHRLRPSRRGVVSAARRIDFLRGRGSRLQLLVDVGLDMSNGKKGGETKAQGSRTPVSLFVKYEDEKSSFSQDFSHLES